MTLKEIRRKLGEAIIGEPLTERARLIGGFHLVSYKSLDRPGSLANAKRQIDIFWKRDRNNVPKQWLEQFLADIEADVTKFAHIESICANHNSVVNDGTRMIFKFMSGQTVASSAPAGGSNIVTLPTMIQLGTSNVATVAADIGCKSPLTTVPGMVESSATLPLPPTTTNSSYTFDTLLMNKPDFLNDSAPPATVTVNEIAMRNTDAAKKCLCRAVTNATPVSAGGTLNATYKLQVTPS